MSDAHGHDDRGDDDSPPATWDYRLICHNDAAPIDQWIGLHEVHYRGVDANGADIITAWTIDATSFACDVDEGPDGVLKSLERALTSARARPMLLMTMLKAQMKQRQYCADNDEPVMIRAVPIALRDED